MTHYHIFLDQRFILNRCPGKWSIWSHSKISGSKRTTDTANMVRTNSVRTTFSRKKRFSVAASEICGGDHIGYHQLSQHRINGEKLSANFRYCGAGRFDPHHVMLLESTSTVQFEQLIWQMPICGGSKRCGQKMTAPYHQRKHQRVKTARWFCSWAVLPY